VKKYKQILRDAVSDVICDACGSSCIPKHAGADASFMEFANLRAEWGYFSGMDGKSFDLDFCEACFNKILSTMNISAEDKLE